MSLIRGFRSLSYGYTRDFIPVPETEENILSYVTLESDSDEVEYTIKIANIWPDFISLNARMIPIKVNDPAIAERFENGKSLGKNQIYLSPIIYHNSSLKNPDFFCSKIVVRFENSGEYFLKNKKISFLNKSFDDYEMKFEAEDLNLFEKKFLMSTGATIERFIKKLGQDTMLEGSSEKAPARIYPYAGFYEYGMHPKEIEACVFQVNSGDGTSAIKISTLNYFRKSGIDPTKNSVLDSGMKFIGVSNFSQSQKMNLYDELLNGSCKISVINKDTNEICEYKSNSLTHIPNTDLITLNFIKG